MESRHVGWARRGGHALWLGGALTLLLGANDDGGCGAEPAASGGEAECQADSECTGDPGIDCTGAWACNAGQCEFECGEVPPPPPPPPTGCYGDADCDGGQVCNAAEVCRQPPGCEEGACDAVCYGECVDPRPPDPQGCMHSGQCPAGHFCTTEIGDCDSNCAEGEACPAACWGQCKPREPGAICYSDSECAIGERCDNDPCVFPEAPADANGADMACGGVCAPSEGCRGPEDCAADEVCACAPWVGDAPANGLVPCYAECQPRERECSADHDCGPGLVCQDGRCREAQRECQADSQCPMGWMCQPQCDAGFAPPPPDGDGDGDSDDPAEPGMPYCPSYCVPQGGTCADTGVVCAPGEVCVNECYSVCEDCDCDPGQDDCACGCWEECRSACVPQSGECVDSQCPPGTHCGCVDPGYPTPANGLVYCEEKCIPDEQQCWSDWDCGEGHYCLPGDCGGGGAEVPCDPSGQSCDPMPPPPSDCPGTCQVKEPEYDCKGDENCVSADGEQGYCRFAVCETFAVPCEPDDPNCAGVEPTCYGYCVYPQPSEVCQPDDPASCPAGMRCEATGSCAGFAPDPDSPDGARPCTPEYVCVPDQVACASDCDCDPSLACNDGVCQRMGRMNLCGLDECTSNADCADDEYCKIDYTQPVCDCVNCPCAIPRGTCEPRPEVRTCDDDADCQDGEYCGCGSDPNCPMCDVCLFQCMPRPHDGSCDSDAECPAGQQCNFYYPPCAPPPDESDFALPPACEPIGVCEDVRPQGCVVTGCSGQICAAQEMASTCEWHDYYQCYRLAICDYGADGACGWQKTDAFVECMERYGQP